MTLLQTENGDYVYSPFYHLSDKKSGKIFCFVIKNNDLNYFFLSHKYLTLGCIIVTALSLFLQGDSFIQRLTATSVPTLIIFLFVLVSFYINSSGGVDSFDRDKIKKTIMQPKSHYIFTINGMACLIFLYNIPVFHPGFDKDEFFRIHIVFMIFCSIILIFYSFLFFKNLTFK